MAHLSLIVKGAKFQAAKAAADRRIPFAFVRENRTAWMNGVPETIGKVPLHYRDKVIEWFNDAPERAPYPVGALLHWAEKE